MNSFFFIHVFFPPLTIGINIEFSLVVFSFFFFLIEIIVKGIFVPIVFELLNLFFFFFIIGIELLSLWLFCLLDRRVGSLADFLSLHSRLLDFFIVVVYFDMNFL